MIENFVGQAIQFGFAGLCFGISIYFFREGNNRYGIIFLTLAVLSACFSKVFEIVINKTSEPIAFWIINTARDYIQGLSFPGRFRKKYYLRMINSLQYSSVDGVILDEKIDLEEIFIPLRLSKRRLSDIDPSVVLALSSKGDDTGEYEIWDFLGLERKKTRIVILGGPGFGKTTLIQHLALSHAQSKNKKKLGRQAPKIKDFIPIILYIRDIHKDISKEGMDLVDLLNHKYGDLNPPARWFSEKLQQGQCLIMLDGIDEIPSNKERILVGEWLQQQIQKYPVNFFILTSRPQGYQSILDYCPKLDREIQLYLEVKSFSKQNIEDFVGRWYKSKDEVNAGHKSRDLINRILSSEYILDLARNPLLLTMILVVHRKDNQLPERRDALYKEIIELLLEERMRARNIKDQLGLSRKEKQQVLQRLALSLSIEQSLRCSTKVARSIVKEQLLELGKNSIFPKEFLESIMSLSGLLREREEGTIEFAHRSFQDYLAAIEIRDRGEEGLLIERVSDSWWQEITLIYMSKGDSSKLIEEALRANTRSSIKLARRAYDEEKVGNQELINRLEQLNLDVKTNTLDKMVKSKTDLEQMSGVDKDKYYRILWWKQAGD